jgi:hypothetical protein
MLQQTTITQLEQIILTELRSESYAKSLMFAESDAYFEAFSRLAGGMTGDQARALRSFIRTNESASAQPFSFDGVAPDYFAGYQLMPDDRLYAEYVTHQKQFNFSTYSWHWVEKDRIRTIIDPFGVEVTF